MLFISLRTSAFLEIRHVPQDLKSFVNLFIFVLEIESLINLSLMFVVPSTGFEPATAGVETQCSIQLSHEGPKFKILLKL